MKNSTIRIQKFRLGVRLALWLALAAVVARGGTAGPDSFGYMASDATPYSFQDISSTGVAVLAGADDDKAQVNIGFSFTFYGQSYSSVCIGSNGLLSFGGCNADFANQDLTATSPAGDYPTIAPFWFDLTFAARGAGAVYYQTLGQAGSRRLVVQWQNAYALNGSRGITFQAMLYEAAGKILFQYLDIDAGAGAPASFGGGATVGIRDTSGQANGRRLQWSYKAPVLRNAEAILFSPQSDPPAALVWLGLKNSDDQGTQFDLRAEIYRNGNLVSAGETRCITGVTRNANLAKSVTVSAAPLAGYAAGEALTLKLLTRIGTNPDGTKCSGPGGSHSNAVGLRLYYDATSRAAALTITVGSNPAGKYYLHSTGASLFLNAIAPTASSAKYQDSAAVNFAGGNVWKAIGTWGMTAP